MLGGTPTLTVLPIDLSTKKWAWLLFTWMTGWGVCFQVKSRESVSFWRMMSSFHLLLPCGFGLGRLESRRGWWLRLLYPEAYWQATGRHFTGTQRAWGERLTQFLPVLYKSPARHLCTSLVGHLAIDIGKLSLLILGPRTGCSLLNISNVSGTVLGALYILLILSEIVHNITALEIRFVGGSLDLNLSSLISRTVCFLLFSTCGFRIKFILG